MIRPKRNQPTTTTKTNWQKNNALISQALLLLGQISEIIMSCRETRICSFLIPTLLFQFCISSLPKVFSSAFRNLVPLHIQIYLTLNPIILDNLLVKKSQPPTTTLLLFLESFHRFWNVDVHIALCVFTLGTSFCLKQLSCQKKCFPQTEYQMEYIQVGNYGQVQYPKVKSIREMLFFFG